MTEAYASGHLYSVRYGAYSIVVAAIDANVARAAAAEWLGQRIGIVPSAVSIPVKRCRTPGDRPLIIAPIG